MAESDGSVLTPGQQIKATLNLHKAKSLVELRYGLAVRNIVELDAYDDRNYRVECDDEHCSNPHLTNVSKYGYVLKIVNSLDSSKTGLIEAQTGLLLYLDKSGFTCPVPVQQIDGTYFSVESLGEPAHERRHILRLLVYRPGEILRNKCQSSSIELLTKLGYFTAELNKNMQGYSHPAYETHSSIWFLSSVPKIRVFISALDSKNDIDLVENIIQNFERQVLTATNNFDSGLIHGDLNESNIIVSEDGSEIAAIIDFGDSHINCFIFELAICLSYMIVQTKSIESARYILEGYQNVRRLPDQEKSVLKLCVCARLSQSLVLGTYSYQKEPTNKYLVRDHEVKWLLLKKVWAMENKDLMNLWNLDV
ncbi:hypothetical protein QAD02_019122 [Eretmocerus hayati]|uniref:Uncharacterized protein n=1 Tax=Eretmocerus hayati TaxID=131215 RepID=A0ACC2PIT0_9HYME|nr:hypothetical protein QAD02_019122 [Eretmocerus hayati]